MSEITMKTIESLPIVEEPAEGASLVGWNNGQTVRVPVDAVGGSKGIVFTVTYEVDESAPVSVEPLEIEVGGTYKVSCNYPFEEFFELFQAGAPMMLVNAYDQNVSSMAQGSWGIGGTIETATLSFIDPSTSDAYAYIKFYTYSGDFYIGYNAEGIYINRGSEA